MPNSKISRTTPETQGFSHWEPPVGVLGELTRAAWIRSEQIAPPPRESERPSARSLAQALRRSTVAVIGEVKRASPSRGSINAGLDPALLANAYERGGASAVSVLTEATRFGGSISDIATVRAACDLPVLRKDFLVTDQQLEEARGAGASAALLIVRAIEPGRLDSLAKTAQSIGLEIVFEVRDQNELERALAAGAEIIGVNNRNLETLEIDPLTVARLVPLIPKACIAIAESGYSTREQVEAAGRSGADAVLIGSFLSASRGPEHAVREFIDIAKVSRD